MVELKKDLVLISEAASVLRIHPETLRRMEAAGKILPSRLNGRRLFSADDIRLAAVLLGRPIPEGVTV